LIKYLTVDDILEIHRLQIQEFGFGSRISSKSNLINPGSLYYVIEEMRDSLFGRELHPSIEEKAAILAYRIITEHVFFDGNKRTAMNSCELFFRLNGYRFAIDQAVFDMAIKIADGKMLKDSFLNAIRDKLIAEHDQTMIYFTFNETLYTFDMLDVIVTDDFERDMLIKNKIYVESSVDNMQCGKHNKFANITISTVDFENFEIRIDGCCRAFQESVRMAIET